MVAVAAADLPRGNWSTRPVLVETHWQADAHLDHLSLLCRSLFAPDLFYRLQAACRRIGMERGAPGRLALEWRTGGNARTHLLLSVFSSQSKIPARGSAEICNVARRVRRLGRRHFL